MANANDRPHGLPDSDTEAMILGYTRAADYEMRPVTLPDILGDLTARLGERGLLPTANQIVEAVRRLLADGRLIDTFDPGIPGSKHILRIPDPKTNRETMKGLFDQ